MSQISTDNPLYPLIAALCGQNAPLADLAPVGGGDTHQAFRLTLRGEAFFMKVNQRDAFAKLQAEAHALKVLNQSQSSLTFPKPIACQCAGSLAGLLLSSLDFSKRHGDAMLGTGLAQLHQHTAPSFGFDRDNFIGATAQSNTWDDDWLRFYGRQRLGMQRDLARDNGLTPSTLRKVDAVTSALPAFFENYRPAASLLHGDLWAGNAGMLSDGSAAIFDPASYYGDRETDLAMTELFGGFSHDFYRAYEAAWPLDSGYRHRRPLYQLYHILNHYNLFGGHYAKQADSLCDEALNSLGIS